jgi:MscS family membrane protein
MGSMNQLIIAFLFIFAGFLGKRVLGAVFHRLRVASARGQLLLSALDVPAQWGALLAGLTLALRILPIPESPIDLRFFCDVILRSASVTLITWFGLRLVNNLTELWARHAAQTETKLDDQLVPIIRSSARLFVILIGFIIILQGLGYSVTSLIAGLGLGGAAIAFASKDALSNLFGSIVIFFDRPFQIGDWIEVGAVEGTVEEVGLRTTKVRTFANSLLTVPNMIFTTTSINNWSAMKRRRIQATIGLAYDTPPDKLRAALAAFRQVITDDPAIHQDFFLVNLNVADAKGVEVLIYCFTVTTQWKAFMDVQEGLLLKLLEALHLLDVGLAVPARRLHVEPSTHSAFLNPSAMIEAAGAAGSAAVTASPPLTPPPITPP